LNDVETLRGEMVRAGRSDLLAEIINNADRFVSEDRRHRGQCGSSRAVESSTVTRTCGS
jgi:hypothetical protein